MPVIDLYLKKQLLKERNLYATNLYGDRLFTDYYHKNFGINDVTNYQSKPMDLSLAHKVHLSWNIGLGDMAGDILPRPIKFVRNLLPPKYPVQFSPNDRKRHLDVMFRGTRKYKRNTISFHRERIGEILDNMKKISAALSGHVSIKQYRQETMDSKIIVSPFGWGEIGVRDFEAWIYGAALMKPDMSHMETWPDVFIPHETYYPVNWNFDNLETGVRQLIEDDDLRLNLADKGRDAYARMVSNEGMEAFCNWFIQQIEK